MDSMFHMCVQLKYDLGHFSFVYIKPNCHCFSTNDQDILFWSECDGALNKINQLLSMVLQILCETKDCLCLEYMHPIIDCMYRCFQNMLVVLSDNQHYVELGMVQTLVKNDELVLYLKSCTNVAAESIDKLNDILKQCDYNHVNLVSRFNACVLCLK